MKLSSILLLLVASLAYGQEAMPRMSSAEPSNGKIGDEVTISGENLDKASIGKVYLTDGKNDLECTITEQTATAVKIKIPAKATGRMALMILTTSKEPKLIEQPVKVTIEQ
ncbi:MAG: IPT/TIG domain-containing protein [Candidatus Solibacter sp.]